MYKLIDIIECIDKIVEDVINIGFDLGCFIRYVLGLDEIIEAINDE